MATLSSQVAENTREIANLKESVSELITIISHQLEDATPQPILKFDLPPLANGRLFYHWNGNPPPRGKTSHGLVLDLGGSAYRWNINFSVISDVKFASLATDPSMSLEEQDTVKRTVDWYNQLSPEPNQEIFMAGAKRNHNPGQIPYRLAPDFTVCSVLCVDNKSQPSYCWIFYGDQKLGFGPDNWICKPGLSYQGVLYIE